MLNDERPVRGRHARCARTSHNQFDFALVCLVCLLGLLGLRIYEATSLDVCDFGEEHGHRVLRVVGKGHKSVLVHMHPQSPEPSTARSATARPGPSCSTAAAHGWTGHAATRRQHDAGVRIARHRPHAPNLGDGFDFLGFHVRHYVNGKLIINRARPVLMTPVADTLLTSLPHL